MPDGVYAYRVAATDRAGNSAAVQLDNVIVDTQETPIQLAIDQSYFSPDGNGVKDAVKFDFRVPVTTGIEKWQLVISDANKAARRTIEGTRSIPTRPSGTARTTPARCCPRAPTRRASRSST